MGDDNVATADAVTPELIDAWTRHARESAQQLQARQPSDTAIERDLLSFFRNTKELNDYFDKLPTHAALAAAAPAEDLAKALVAFDAQPRLHPEVHESDGTGMRYYDKRKFRNWGQTVANRPQLTFVPRTKQGLCNLVSWAKARNQTVRAAGYRHTWGDLYSDDGQILVSMLPLRFVEELPAFEPKLDPANELQGIEIVGTVNENGVQKALCRIGAATTNEMFREWCIGNRKDDWRWTIPFNVIMVEITYGGSNAPICHGAGRQSTTLSDLVTSIEFVNARGQLQTVNDPQLLKVAAGCFGLLGIVTSITLKLDPMTYARMQPVAPRVALAVPPPQNYPVPAAIDMSGITPAALDAARADFVQRCKTDYYAEWFWFTYQDRCWVNTWKNDGRKENAEDYPGELKSDLQATMEYLGQVANTTVFKLLPGRTQATLAGSLAMSAFPKDTTIETPLIDALHFQRGIQNMRVLDMEFEIPIPGRSDAPDQPDWSICQRAWWDAISIVYARKDTPMRLTMEMRITGGSSIVLAPQNGNRLGTCSIEVLTTPNTDPSEWKSFMQQIVDAWSKYTDANGEPLNLRPHWAKQWQGLTVRGTPIVQHLRQQAYAARLPDLAQGFQQIAAAGGYTVADLSARFSNLLLRELFGGALG